MAAYLHPADAGGRAFLAPADVVAYVSNDYTISYAIDAVTLVSNDYSISYAIDPMPLVSNDYTINYAILNGEPMTLVRSAARTITVEAGARAFTAVTPGFWETGNPKKPKGLKDPNSTIDISFNWTPWLADIGGANIAAIVWESGNATRVSEPPSDDGKHATVVLGAGSGEVALTCRITTDTVPPLVEDRTVYLTIEDR